jgi:Flp pilus assembly protein TadB
MTATAVVCVVGAGTGVAGLIMALGARFSIRAPKEATLVGPGQTGRQHHDVKSMAALSGYRWMVRVAPPLVIALLVGVVTRWPVAALLAGVAAASLPSALRSTASHDSTRRTEAVAIWTELLRDTLTGSAGLAQAIVSTAGVAPDEIREPAVHLADRIMSGVPMDDALQLFAAEVDDPGAEEVVRALRLAAISRAHRLVDLLGSLADSTRDEVSMRLRVESSRASARSGVRTVMCFSVGFVVLLTVMARSYLAPYGSVMGQLVLIIVGACYAVGLSLMVRLVRPSSGRRPSREAARS